MRIHLLLVILFFSCPLALASQAVNSAYTQCEANITKFNGLLESIHVFVQELDDSDHELTVPEVRMQLRADIQEAWLLLEEIQDFLCLSCVSVIVARCGYAVNYYKLALLLGVESCWASPAAQPLDQRKVYYLINRKIAQRIDALYQELDSYQKQFGIHDFDLSTRVSLAKIARVKFVKDLINHKFVFVERNKLAKDVITHIIIPGALWCFTGLVHVALIASCWWG